MNISDTFNQFIERWNVLQGPTQKLDDFFREHPNIFKVALVINHIFRAFAISFMMGAPICWPICFIGSLFYRMTVEKNCAFKFALPSLAGGACFLKAKPAIDSLTIGIALTTLEQFSKTFFALIPLGVYFSYIALTVDYEVRHRPCLDCSAAI